MPGDLGPMGVEWGSGGEVVTNLNRSLEAKLPAARGGIYYQNNPFLGMFQLKFC